MKLVLLTILCFFVSPSSAMADLSLNIGYQNPAVSRLGINFMHSWSNVALELGIGDINADLDLKDEENNDENDKDKNDTNIGVAGDIDVKFFLANGGVRPYLQVGTLLGTQNLSAGTGHVFAGGGVFLGSKKFYAYASANYAWDFFIQAGLGFDI